MGTWILMFPPSMLHSISKLKFVSLLGVMCPFIMASIIVYFGIDEMVKEGFEANFDNVQWFTNTPKGVFVAIPIFCFALQSHISVPVIFNGYPKVQKKSNFRFVIVMAYVIVTSLYVVFEHENFNHFTFSCFNYVAEIRRTSLASLTHTARKSLENERSNADSIVT